MDPVRWLLFVAVALVSLPALAAEPIASGSPTADAPVAIRAWFTVEGGAGVVSVQATLAHGFHTYSVTDGAKAQRTEIALSPSGQYRQAGAIRATTDPERTYDPQSQQTVEKHRGVVTWTVPVRFAAGVDPAKLSIAGHVKLQVCNVNVCQPVAENFDAVYRTTAASQSPAAEVASDQFANDQFPTGVQNDKFDDILGGGFGGRTGGAGDKVSIKASVEPADKPTQLVIEATIKSGWHIYSLTQPKGGQLPTKIDVNLINAELTGPFRTDPPPKKVYSDIFKITAEEHSGKVRWTVPLKIAAAAESEGYKIDGTVSIQACNEGACVSEDHPFVAFDSTKKSAANVGEYRAPSSHVTIRGSVEPGTVAPGGAVKLVLTAEPQGDFHVYPVTGELKTARPTLIAVSNKPQGWTVGEPLPSTSPVSTGDDPYHKGPVTWTVEIKVPTGAAAGPYTLGGGIAYMACQSATLCESPSGALYEVTIDVEGKTTNDRRPLRFFSSKYDEVKKRTLSAAKAASIEALRLRWRPVVGELIAATGSQLYSHDALGRYSAVELEKLPKTVDAAAGGNWLSVLAFLGAGFLGGLILNVMPCVLPVIGLKIMSFMQQGGESRGRVFRLNVWFSLGLIAVFLVLAAFAVFAKLGWGGQFQEAWFTIVLACVVFAFALALIGVWEVPIPGFIGSGAVGDLAAKEGPAGAFSKGALTTVLATPCTGPFLGPALAWAVNQPAPLVFATFAAVGLGMASPYLLIGAFPKLIAFLPKPGAWMETFKKLMGFILLATVVWLLSFVPAADVLPTVTVLCGLGLAFWWIGSTPLTEPAGKRLLAWGQAVAIIVGVSWFSFAWFDEVMKDRAERRFKSDMVSQLVKFAAEPENYQTEQRPPGRYTVMVDFTADWCLTCKTNEQFVLSTKTTKELIKKNNVVFLVADITTDHPEAQDLLKRLGNDGKTIPCLAIFPADHPNQPIVLNGPVTQGQVSKALEQAGPSNIDGGTTAMRTP
jgi:suppressor for copper-sensitivity B